MNSKRNDISDEECLTAVVYFCIWYCTIRTILYE